MRFVPLTAALLCGMPLRGSAAYTTIARAAEAVRPGLSFAMLDGGYIAGAGGVIPLWPGRATAWIIPSVFSRPRHYARAVAFARHLLDDLQTDHRFRRIECQVIAHHAAARRYAEALGFVQETPALLAWAPDGAAAIQYVRLRTADSVEAFEMRGAAE